MINVNELRMGNWVKINGIEWQIDDLCFGGISFFEINGRQYNRETGGNLGTGADEVKPIYVEKEILLKCGFAEKEIKPGLIRLVLDTFQGVIFGEFRGQIFRYDTNLRVIGKPIEYLHDLQNAFYSLTGEDLKIDLYTP